MSSADLEKVKKKLEPARSLLIESLMSLVSEIGAHQITLQKVAKRAKIPFSTAHYYFGGNKDLIFKEAAIQAGTQGQNYIAAYLQKHSNLNSNPVELYIKGTFQWLKDHPIESRYWLFNYYYSSLNPDFIEQQALFIENARKRVLNLLFEAKGRGFYPKLNLTPDLAAQVHTLIFGLGIMSMIQNFDVKIIHQFRQETLKQVGSILNSALNHSPLK